MKKIVLSVVALALVLGFASPTLAQDEAETDPYWYVSMYNIPWAKADSMDTLVEKDQALVAEAIARGRFLDAKVLRHHTGSEWNYVLMTKYADWASIDEGGGLNALAEEMWGEEAAQARQDAYSYVFQGATAHRDYIYQEVSGN